MQIKVKYASISTTFSCLAFICQNVNFVSAQHCINALRKALACNLKCQHGEAQSAANGNEAAKHARLIDSRVDR